MSPTAAPRLLVVSAHFPPDFVSGGTLVPDREARGLQARGWDVSVFAGSLDPTRMVRSTWSEDVDGLAVRWVAIAPFTSWADRRNFDHPEVEAIFARHLARHPVDVVHLHALQTFGGGLVRTAKASGAAVVVTMHDFWWTCARQFLVDPAGVPCSLVVDAGVCPCSVDHAWLEERNECLRSALEGADLVLTPSGILAAALEANGVGTGRLRVLENGMRRFAAPPRATDGTGVVTFRYLGGADVLKGARVALEAGTRLAGRRPGGWRLVAHGDVDDLRALVGHDPGPAVELAPPFPPTELETTLAASDVLLVPSVARESHSLVTREALLLGVPVICSDSLGPEEVVLPDHNGLVVPTGDPDALATAMERVLDEPEQLRRWSRNAPTVEVRTEEEHLEELDVVLRTVVPRAGAAAASRRSPIERVLFVVGIDGAPLRYRAHLPAEALALRGVRSAIRHYRDPDVPELAAGADAVVLYRVPATLQILDLLDGLRRDRPGVPLLFDVDDLIFDPDIGPDDVPSLARLEPSELDLYLEGVRRYRTTMEACDAYIGSTEELCAQAAALTGLPSHRYPNGVGLVLARRSDRAVRRPVAPGPPRVGYFSGTTTHDLDWATVEPVVLDVLDAHPEAELWLGGHLQPSRAVDRLGPRLHRLPLVDWRELPELLRDVTVNLAPLELVGRFNESKSAIKWLEAALCATPTIATPTQPFVEAIESGVNGFLASTPGEWGHHLDALLRDPALRDRVGARARRDALLDLSPHRQADRYLAILDAEHAAVAAGRPLRTPRAERVALDEPPEPHPLTPYGDDDPPMPSPAATATPSAGLAGRAARAAARRGRRFARVTVDEGPSVAVRRAAGRLRADARRVLRRLR